MKWHVIIGVVFLLTVGCGDEKEADPAKAEKSDRPTIAVVNYPLAYFAERLAGDFADVLFEAPVDEDPAFWTPNDAQVAKIQKANLIFLNGASYAKWTDTTSLPFEVTVDTALAFEDKLIEVEGALTHTHAGDDEPHSHAGTAFTTWLDMKQAAAHAEAMAEAIIEEWPDRKEAVTKNLVALTKDLLGIDRSMREVAQNFLSDPIVASHPIYHYWERAYGVKVPSVLWEPEMTLDDKAMAELDKILKEHPTAKYFMWEGQPAAGHPEKLDTVGLESFVFEPAGNRPESGDFLSVMKANIAALKALKAE